MYDMMEDYGKFADEQERLAVCLLNNIRTLLDSFV